MEVAKLIYNPPKNVKIINNKDKHLNSIILTAYKSEAITYCKEIIDNCKEVNTIKNYSDLNIELNYVMGTETIVRDEYENEYNLWTKKQEEYKYNLKEIIKNIEKLGYKFTRYSVKFPEGSDDKKEWYEKVECCTWYFLRDDNLVLLKELRKLDKLI